jgi:hypothetical protein
MSMDELTARQAAFNRIIQERDAALARAKKLEDDLVATTIGQQAALVRAKAAEAALRELVLATRGHFWDGHEPDRALGAILAAYPHLEEKRS